MMREKYTVFIQNKFEHFVTFKEDNGKSVICYKLTKP